MRRTVPDQEEAGHRTGHGGKLGEEWGLEGLAVRRFVGLEWLDAACVRAEVLSVAEQAGRWLDRRGPHVRGKQATDAIMIRPDGGWWMYGRVGAGGGRVARGLESAEEGCLVIPLTVGSLAFG